MASILVNKSRICGIVPFLPSKSLLQRGMLLAGLFGGSGKVAEFRNALCGDDVKACFRAAELIRERNVEIYCGDNATLFRMLAPVRLSLEKSTDYILSERLFLRTKEEIEFLSAVGAKCVIKKGDGIVRVSISGVINQNPITVDCRKTSQLFSGFLIASALTGKKIIPVGNSSFGYAKMTLGALSKYGYDCITDDGVYSLFKKEDKQPASSVFIENDWSRQANFLVAGILSGEVFVPDLPVCSDQSDSGIFDILKNAGCYIECKNGGILAKTGDFDRILCDASKNPDIVPILSVLAVFGKRTSIFLKIGRLSAKESDRILGCMDLIKAAGANCSLENDTLLVFPAVHGQKADFSPIDARSDHRISMAAAVLGAKTGNVIIRGYDCTSKSDGRFYDDFRQLGGNYNVIDLG